MREPELLKAVIAAWDGIATALTLLPGGLHEHMAQDDNVPDAAQKWATVKVEEGPISRVTNGGPIREHTVTVTMNDASGGGVSGNATLMDTLGTIPSVVNKSLDNGGHIIDMWPAQAKGGGQTDDTRRTKPIVELAIAWRVQSRWPY